MNNTPAIVREIKAGNQDFEWYPTTDEIISCMASSLNAHGRYDVLEIGAGDGRVFQKLKENNVSIDSCKAIEKSPILRAQLDSSVEVVGCDFHHNTLIDKKVNVIFCNPPYSDFESWTARIIKEANAELVYLVIPERWSNSRTIEDALESRKVTAKSLGDFDFHNAERSARAKVQLIKIRYQHNSIDPFSLWFGSHFKPTENNKSELNAHKEKNEHSELIKSKAYIPTLVDLYTKEMENTQEAFTSLNQLSSKVFSALGIKQKDVASSMQAYMTGLKTTYWKELFSHLESIRSRFTFNQAELFASRVSKNHGTDFNLENAYMVVQWLIANSVQYLDQQLIDMYKTLTNERNMSLYKSNKIYLDGKTRWEKQQAIRKATKYALDYRIVHDGHHVTNQYYSCWQNDHQKEKDFLKDLIVIAGNLGFNISHDEQLSKLEITTGQAFEIKQVDGNVFAKIRCYKNGNVHINFSQAFMQAFNLRAGYLLGWLKSPEHAASETGYKKEKCQQWYSNTHALMLESQTILPQLAIAA